MPNTIDASERTRNLMKRAFVTTAALMALTTVFIFRLFFLEEGANAFFATASRALLYIGSMALAAYVFIFPLVRFRRAVSKYRALFITAFVLTALEGVLFHLNGIALRGIYPFGLFVVFAMLFSFTRLLPRIVRKPFAVFFVIAYGIYLIFQDVHVQLFYTFASFPDFLKMPSWAAEAPGDYRFFPFAPIAIGVIFALLALTLRTSAYSGMVREKRTLFVMAGVWALALTLLNFNADYSVRDGSIHADD